MTEPSHHDAAVAHLEQAAHAETGSADERYHLAAANTHAVLAGVDATNRQAAVVETAAQINARFIELMTEAEPDTAEESTDA